MNAYSEKDVLYDDNCATTLSDAELENVFGGGGQSPFGVGTGGLGSGALANSFGGFGGFPGFTVPTIVLVNVNRNNNRRREEEGGYDNGGYDNGGNDHGGYNNGGYDNGF